MRGLAENGTLKGFGPRPRGLGIASHTLAEMALYATEMDGHLGPSFQLRCRDIVVHSN
jgi:hypothetical protein